MVQFKRVCDSNGDSKSIAMWLLPFFMAESPAASVNIHLTSRKNVDASAIISRKIERQERICSYIEIVIYPRDAFPTGNVIVKEVLEIELFKMYSNQTAVQFA